MNTDPASPNAPAQAEIWLRKNQLADRGNVASEVGLRLVVLDVIGDGGNEVLARRMEFYRRLGFQSIQDRPERMFIAIDTIRAMFGDG